MTVGRRKAGKNEISWLIDGPGAHGDEPVSPDNVIRSLAEGFRFVAATDTAAGLRPPQLGALHAVLAARTTEVDEPVTVVMPTGTGKTETMLAVFAFAKSRLNRERDCVARARIVSSPSMACAGSLVA
jgi:hypothetical protein